MKGNRILVLVVLILAASAVVFIGWNRYFDSQTNQSQQAEIAEGWTQYENKRFGFSFSYPDDWYLHDVENDYTLVSVSPVSPDDPRRASDIGLHTSFNTKLLQEESIEAHVQTITDNPYIEDFTSSEITLDNGAVVPFISYGSPSGARWHESFITLSDSAILRVWFSPSEETYMQTLRSFRWRR